MSETTPEEREDGDAVINFYNAVAGSKTGRKFDMVMMLLSLFADQMAYRDRKEFILTAAKVMGIRAHDGSRDTTMKEWVTNWTPEPGRKPD